MKIISKFKDYYDFVIGYDTDPRKIYVRTFEVYQDYNAPSKGKFEIFDHIKSAPKYNKTAWEGNDEYFVGKLWFCDQFYSYIYFIDKNKYYWKFEDIPIELKEKYDYTLHQAKPKFQRSKKINDNQNRNKLKEVFEFRRNKKHYFWLPKTKDFIDRKMNTEFGEPVVFTRLRDKLIPEIIVNGNLSEIKFNSIKPPKEAYTDLYNWIPYNEPMMPNDPHDLIRFEGKGFDKKTSFRGK